MRQVTGIAQRHGRPLLGRQAADQLPEAVGWQLVARVGADGARPSGRFQFRHRDGPPSMGPVVVDRLAVGDRQQPGAQVGRVAQPWVGAHRRDERLLEAVVGVDGPDLALPPKVAVSLALGLHELCTNAAKYGALSVPTGEVTLVWATAGRDPRRLILRWAELGGPAVRPPERKGFGTRLIEIGLARELGGEVRLEFKPAGVVCEITVPLGSEAPAA